jgi:hypothetical protein
MNIIDFHTHAFPDALAKRAVPLLEEEGNVRAYTDGTVSSLLSSMNAAGINTAVLASIATKKEQFSSILEWSLSIASPRIFPFASIHPEDNDIPGHIETIKNSGLKGIKLHPYYQRFRVDAKEVFPVYEEAQAAELILLIHTGYDIAFPRERIGGPEAVLKVVEDFPRLKLVTTHLGAWEDWDAVEEYMLGKEIYTDISYSIPFLGLERAKVFMLQHPKEYLLFGSDSPWDDQSRLVETVLEMDLGTERTERLLYANAAGLLATDM